MTEARHYPKGVPVGDGKHISPAEFLLVAGFLVYRAPLAPTAARVAARLILDAFSGQQRLAASLMRTFSKQ